MPRLRYCSLLVLAMTCQTRPVSGFVPDDRWTTTASGPTGEMGDPITLTWSFVPDGTLISGEGPSDLISFLDGLFGEGAGGADLRQRPWFDHFAQSFDRWSQLSGMSFEYEPADDGVTHGTVSGALGTRGDVRIGGVNVDGSGDTLAYNFFPNNGDMVLDTAESAFFGNPSGGFLRLRNTIMHEHGHGLGLSHVVSNTSSFLMEPVISTAFDGPQFDDIRGVQWFYGDALEKSNNGLGNDRLELATELGSLLDGATVQIGSDAGPDTVIGGSETDFVSIDSNTDIDFYSIRVPFRF